MTKILKSKHKVDRRLKANLWGRPKSPFNSRAYPPGQHGQNKRGKPTDYGIQLQAKQKLKAYYGNINERQFRNIYRKALAKRGDTTENLIALTKMRNNAKTIGIEKIRVDKKYGRLYFNPTSTIDTQLLINLIQEKAEYKLYPDQSLGFSGNFEDTADRFKKVKSIINYLTNG